MKKPKCVRKKAEFRVGQVVANSNGSYFKIRARSFRTDLEAVRFAWFYREIWSEWNEKDLRPLTKRERGQ